MGVLTSQDRKGASNRPLMAAFRFSQLALLCAAALPIIANRRSQLASGGSECGNDFDDYRTIDGTCNNKKNRELGSVGTTYRRLMLPQYEGEQDPIGWDPTKSYNGHPKPSPRTVTNLIKRSDQFTTDLVRSALFSFHGQFLTHDIALTPFDSTSCSLTCMQSQECFPIPVTPGPGETRFNPCIPFARSLRQTTDAEGHNQWNNITHWIDASNVYGSSEAVHEAVRDDANRCELRKGQQVPGGKHLLPRDNIGIMLCESNVEFGYPLPSPNCFLAGDVRANQQLSLITMHTIWVREHNRIAQELQGINPHWDCERVYQESKKILTAEFQHITYEEWLPLVIGDLPKHTSYSFNIDPRVTSAFSTAAFRLHVVINPLVHRLDTGLQEVPQGHLPINRAAFVPDRLTQGGGVDALLRGMAFFPAKAITPSRVISDELTERLFQSVVRVAGDLASTNIQRGRDHGLPGYLEWRRHLGLPASGDDTSCQDLSTAGAMDQSVCATLLEIYGHLGNVDLWVGGLMEKVDDDILVGDTFKAIIKDTFINLRDGDRFWYEEARQFHEHQRREIKKATISRVVCDNGDNIQQFSRHGFKYFQTGSQVPSLEDCDSFPRVDLSKWKE